ncbi:MULTISPECIES: hypothetical protein [Marinobacter]|uniref:Uncharacterized protein n=1 Tax=Marinobacter salexigens TaxID=1925763 RepID=A0ABS6A5G9_9GAMM|nr:MULTISPECIES: hypothetical protein [Marinobacter]MBU2873453.1 hypothetical protein [Marinobacter salexigens]
MGLFSFYKGRKVGSPAKVEALQKGPVRQRIDVVELALENGDKGVGLKVVATSFLSYQALPVSLNKEQAVELAQRILKAVDED